MTVTTQIFALVVGQLVTAPMPCQNMVDVCRQSVKVTNNVGATVDDPRWEEGEMKEGFEKGKCYTGMLKCHEGKEGCAEYSECVPTATRCVQVAIVKAYGLFGTSECEAYINCMMEKTTEVCLASFGNSMVVDGNPTTNCDSAGICDIAGAMSPPSGCNSKPFHACQQDSSCTWVSTSQRCDDSESEKDLLETLTIIVALVLLLCVIGCCVAYAVHTHTKQPPSSFKNLDEDEFELAPHHITSDDYAY